MSKKHVYKLTLDLRLYFNIEAESEEVARSILLKQVADPRFLMLGLGYGVMSTGFEPQRQTLSLSEAPR